MMKLRTTIALASACVLSACATDQPAPVATARAPAAPATSEFRTSDFAWSTAPGKGRVDGQIAFKSGRLAYACGEAGVVLTPETPWTKARMAILYNSSSHAALPASEVRARTPPGRSADYSAFVKRATCDGAGRFTFSGLPDGAWYVITVAKPVGPGTDMAIMRRVTVKGGKPVSVKL